MKQPLIIVFILLFISNLAFAEDFKRHGNGASGDLQKFRPIMSFDSNSCLPIAAIEQIGTSDTYKINRGESDRHTSRNCRTASLTQAYGNSICQTHGGNRYCAHVYAFYFEKDRAQTFNSTGHTHDWEHVIMWVKDGVVRFMTTSDHRGTEQWDLYKDDNNDGGIASDTRKTGNRYHVRYFRTDGGFSTNSFKREKVGDSFSSTDYRLSDTAGFSANAINALNTGDFGRGVQRVVGSNVTNYLRDKQPNDNGWRKPMNF